MLGSPTTDAAARRAHAVGPDGFTIGGVPLSSATRASTPYASATCDATRTTSDNIISRDTGSTARTVPLNRARSGITFGAVPALIVPIVTTPGVAGLRRRATMVW